MHINQQDYNKLISFTKTFVQKKPHIDAGDIVNEVLLEMISNNEIFILEQAIERVKKCKLIYEKTVEGMGNDFSKHDTDRVCKDCKEVLPVGAFYIRRQKTKLAISSYCKNCDRIRCLRYNRQDEVKERRNAWARAYRKTKPKLSKDERSEVIRKSWEKRKGLNVPDTHKNTVAKKIRVKSTFAS